MQSEVGAAARRGVAGHWELFAQEDAVLEKALQLARRKSRAGLHRQNQLRQVRR